MKPYQAQRKAYTVIMRLIRHGVLAAPSTHPCFDCGAAARDYHHFIGYEFPLHVLPLCRPCHFKREPRYTNRKLSALDVRAIRSSSDTGKSLAEKYGVDRSAISLVRSRKTYREIA